MDFDYQNTSKFYNYTSINNLSKQQVKHSGGLDNLFGHF